MKIGLLGGHGQLGTEFARQARDAGHQISAPASSTVDITDQAAVKSWVDTTAADAWVNAAAYTAVDAAEDNKEAAYRVNVLGATHLSQALAAANSQAPLIYFSTDYVFDGLSGAPYGEDAPTAPQSVYGTTKLAGESASLAYQQGYVLRISWVFGNDGHNFVKSILRAAQRFDGQRDAEGVAPPLRVVDDQWGAPCATASIARAVLALLCSPPAPGVYHFANQPHTNWHRFATAIVEEASALGLLSQPVDVLTQPTSALNQKATRPPDGRLSMDKLQAAIGFMAEEWRPELHKVLKAISPDPPDYSQ